MLADRGISVTEAADGAQALQCLKDDPGATLLLSDIVMPNMNGYELVEASLKLRPELKILMMTAYRRRAAAAGGAEGARNPHPDQALRSRPDVRPGRGHAGAAVKFLFGA
jgi:CheY-like chemotaxis protein